VLDQRFLANELSMLGTIYRVTLNFTSLNAFRSSIVRADFSNYLMCYR